MMPFSIAITAAFFMFFSYVLFGEEGALIAGLCVFLMLVSLVWLFVEVRGAVK